MRGPYLNEGVYDGVILTLISLHNFENYIKQPGRTKDIVSICVQVAFIVAGSTHMGYYKTLKHALGIDVVGPNAFMDTIRNMYPIVKSMLDEMCESAKQEMKDKK